MTLVPYTAWHCARCGARTNDDRPALDCCPDPFLVRVDVDKPDRQPVVVEAR